MRILKKNIILSAILIFLILSFTKTSFAQDIILNDLNNNPVNVSSYKGKPVIFFFWTTWCPHCRKEIKSLNQNYEQFKKDGILIFAVNIGESDYKVKRFFKNYQLNYKVLLDKDGLLAENYGVMGVPTYILLNKAGKEVGKENTLPNDYKNLMSD